MEKLPPELILDLWSFIHDYDTLLNLRLVCRYLSAVAAQHHSMFNASLMATMGPLADTIGSDYTHGAKTPQKVAVARISKARGLFSKRLALTTVKATVVVRDELIPAPVLLNFRTAFHKGNSIKFAQMARWPAKDDIVGIVERERPENAHQIQTRLPSPAPWRDVPGWRYCMVDTETGKSTIQAVERRPLALRLSEQLERSELLRAVDRCAVQDPTIRHVIRYKGCEWGLQVLKDTKDGRVVWLCSNLLPSCAHCLVWQAGQESRVILVVDTESYVNDDYFYPGWFDVEHGCRLSTARATSTGVIMAEEPHNVQLLGFDGRVAQLNDPRDPHAFMDLDANSMAICHGYWLHIMNNVVLCCPMHKVEASWSHFCRLDTRDNLRFVAKEFNGRFIVLASSAPRDNQLTCVTIDVLQSTIRYDTVELDPGQTIKDATWILHADGRMSFWTNKSIQQYTQASQCKNMRTQNPHKALT